MENNQRDQRSNENLNQGQKRPIQNPSRGTGSEKSFGEKDRVVTDKDRRGDANTERTRQ